MIQFKTIVFQVKRVVDKKISRLRHIINVRKGHFAVYVGVDEEEAKRFVVPISYLNHPLFQALLHQAEDEFGTDHKRKSLTIPCAKDVFIDITSRLKRSKFIRTESN
ncbi:Small auxin-up RNA [Arabidopsis thaliana x Arabidopsis arenosa]|uniref:Small auxin-up RNA n=1 Tax=Arabidopsis thaliana x Arabidopsis arenosa TaxID=1240361 RepID=A0A8T1Y617_9BRAS|nr:Small auxin-up RNA [Arabidopsis thaliana x Arabidopsis arenosa]